MRLLGGSEAGLEDGGRESGACYDPVTAEMVAMRDGEEKMAQESRRRENWQNWMIDTWGRGVKSSDWMVRGSFPEMRNLRRDIH